MSILEALPAQYINTNVTMQVSTNGVISFQSEFTDFTVSSFPTSSIPLIAPLWADFDFRDREGNVFYRIAEDEATLKSSFICS